MRAYSVRDTLAIPGGPFHPAPLAYLAAIRVNTRARGGGGDSPFLFFFAFSSFSYKKLLFILFFYSITHMNGDNQPSLKLRSPKDTRIRRVDHRSPLLFPFQRPVIKKKRTMVSGRRSTR